MQPFDLSSYQYHNLAALIHYWLAAGFCFSLETAKRKQGRFRVKPVLLLNAPPANNWLKKAPLASI